MVVDTSALVAILQREPEREAFLCAMATASVRVISTASAVETSMVVLSRSKEEGLHLLGACFASFRSRKCR
ncbi:type II toxin-antitoxin system VapC family toxin [Jiella sp. M17.18]|uniref:type II toxin-antitoxin system VapC family toxin n=1 Tax=Jiella sp. M17.18 TaxID=3234247 RepID=UPI0034DE426E